MPSPAGRVAVLGASGSIGSAVVGALTARGYTLTCPGRGERMPDARFDAVISCIASRTGVHADAWAVDYRLNLDALEVAKAAGTPHFILVSAICVQRPRLAFQHAKLAFEAELTKSGLRWTIVRPTAFFKSLSGQAARVKAGKPFLVFGDGKLTACKPISDDDLARYVADCLDDPDRWNQVLPIGGPGPAITPLDQAAMLCAAFGRPVRVRSVPVRLLDVIGLVLAGLARIIPSFSAKAEFARIGRYYATESMLVFDPATGHFDASLTPETGTETLADHYAALARVQSA
jgi:divinyl chlorophyllide a 8-vinyl-reductase